MKHRAGLLLLLFGAALIGSALLLFWNNRDESASAGKASARILTQVEAEIVAREDILPQEFCPAETMPQREIDGNTYIGILSVPALELTLPVMSDWSYPQLKVAPCRFTGSVGEGNLVIMAHNYDAHFGRLGQLQPGDVIEFRDMVGRTYQYTVVLTEILQPTAVEEMESGGYDLTLFTCTYGGENRITVRCSRLS